MADTKKIDELDPLGAAPATDDLLPLWDSSASLTLSVTVDEIIEAVATELLSTDGTFAANSDAFAPTQKAAKTYVATVAATKENSITATTSADYYRGDKTFHTLNAAAVGLGNVDNTSDSTKNSATATLTNKRITKRVSSISSSATPSINSDNMDIALLTSMAANVTSLTTNLTGTPTDGQYLELRWASTTGTNTISHGSGFQSSGVATMLTATVSGKKTTELFKYDAALSKFVLMAVDAVGY